MRAGRRLITGWLMLLLATGPVAAAPFDHAPYQPLLIAQRDHGGNDSISLDAAVAQARQRYNGKVLSAETKRVDGRKVHRIKILTQDGRVKRLQVDAGTGKNKKHKQNKKYKR
jgi:uncharacterized membrane protein YkoI